MSSSNHKYYFLRKYLRLPGYDYSGDGLFFITIDCYHLECRFGKIIKGKMTLNDFGEIAFDEWLKLSDRFDNFQLDTFQIMPNHMHAIVSLINPKETRGYVIESSLREKEMDSLREKEVDSLDETEAGASPANTSLELTTNKLKVLAGLAPASVSNSNFPVSVLSPNIQASISFPIAPVSVSSVGSKNLSDIIGSYKSIVANSCLEFHKQKYAGISHMPLLGKIWKRGFWDTIIRDEDSYKAISRYIRNNPKDWAHDRFYRK